MNFLKEIIKNKNIYCKKKGYTLIELIISMTLGIIIMASIVTVFCTSKKFFNVENKRELDTVTLQEAIYFIEKEIDMNTEYLQVNSNNNEIKLYMKKKPVVKTIKLINNNLYMLNGTNNSEPNENSYKNYIMKGIKKFNVDKIGNLLYINLETELGGTLKKCYFLRKEKNQDLS